MELTEQRPRLASFRALAFHGENQGQANGTGTDEWTLKLAQEIGLGLAVPVVPGAPLQAIVKIELRATSTTTRSASDSAQFSAVYEGKFDYPGDASEATVSPMFEQEPYQYTLVAQVFPLAMTHFRRELQSMGLDARSLPLGL